MRVGKNSGLVDNIKEQERICYFCRKPIKEISDKWFYENMRGVFIHQKCWDERNKFKKESCSNIECEFNNHKFDHCCCAERSDGEPLVSDCNKAKFENKGVGQ
jgi:hypothetical protein